MGTDITVRVEIRLGDGKWHGQDASVRDRQGAYHEPFEWRSYDMFSVLAQVRNISEIPVVFPCKYAWPEDSPLKISHDARPKPTGSLMDFDESLWETYMGGCGSRSWLTVAELLAFDYDLWVLDKRPSDPKNPVVTYREFLGAEYFESLARLQELGEPAAVRILFCFN